MQKVIKKAFSDICNVIIHSVYWRWINNNKGMIFACVIISTFLCFLSYPGIIYSDSYSRIDSALGIKSAIQALFNAQSDYTGMKMWITVLPSFFIMLSIEIVGSIVLYTFVQCLLLFIMSYSFVGQLSEKAHKLWNYACVTLLPVLWAYGVYYEAGVGCITAIMMLLLIIWKWSVLESTFDKIITFILLVFSSFVCFGYRANAFVIIPALLLIIILKERKAFRVFMFFGSVCVGLLLSVFVPSALKINTMSSYAGAFIWETVSTIQSMDEVKQKEYSTYFDDIFGEGVTAAALEKNTYDKYDSSINPILWGNAFDIDEISTRENSADVLKKYFELIVNEPGSYIGVKWEFISHTLGINKPLKFAEYNYNRDNRMGTGLYSFNDSKPRRIYVDSFILFMEYMEIFRKPWILFLISGVLIIVFRVSFYGRKKNINLYEASYAVALFYYGGFLLNTQSFEFRYFFPSFLLLFFIIISVTADMFVQLNRKLPIS